MNKNDELKRLKRFVVFSWTLVLLLIVGLVTWGSVQLRSLNHQITLASNRAPLVIHGVDGQDGSQGISGVNGVNGLNGQSGSAGQNVSASQIASAVADYFTVNPPTTIQGAPGIAGTDGLTLQIQVDPVTCHLQTKYDGADNWANIAQLPIPCVTTELPL